MTKINFSHSEECRWVKSWKLNVNTAKRKANLAIRGIKTVEINLVTAEGRKCGTKRQQLLTSDTVCSPYGSGAGVGEEGEEEEGEKQQMNGGLLSLWRLKVAEQEEERKLEEKSNNNKVPTVRLSVCLCFKVQRSKLASELNPTDVWVHF